MSTVNTPDEEPREPGDEATVGPDVQNDPAPGTGHDTTGHPPAPHNPAREVTVPQRLAFTSVPALLTSLLLSVVLFIAVLYGWYAIGPEIRSQISLSQSITLLVVALTMVAVMLSVGYSRLYADERGVVIRNGPVLRKFPIDRVAGLRLRDGDPWAYLLVKDGKGGAGRHAVLAIQQLEGARGKRKVTQLRRWLKVNGATSKGITLDRD